MPEASELFTPANIAALAISTAAVNAAVNTLRIMFKIPPKRTAFAASLVIAFLVVAMKPSPPWYEWVLAFFNACLLFCSALGFNESASAPTGSGKGHAKPSSFFGSWFARQP